MKIKAVLFLLLVLTTCVEAGTPVPLYIDYSSRTQADQRVLLITPGNVFIGIISNGSIWRGDQIDKIYLPADTAYTNWVDVWYYPRSNPSNWVTMGVTNGLAYPSVTNGLWAMADGTNYVFLSTNTLWSSLTNWVDIGYYPRSNPSNYISTYVDTTFTNYLSYSGPGTFTGLPRSGSNTLTIILSDLTAFGLLQQSDTNALVTTNDSRNLYFTGRQTNTQQLVLYNSSTNSSDGLYDLNPNGVFLDGPTNVGKWLTWGNTGMVDWAAGIFQSEAAAPGVGNEFWYLYQNHGNIQPIQASAGGRVALGGRPDNIMDYHALRSLTVTNDDLNVGGLNTASQLYRYKITLTTPTNWTWAKSVDLGVTYVDSLITQLVSTTAQSVTAGITVAWDSATAHATGDSWQIYGWPQLPQATVHIAPSAFNEIAVITNTFAGSTTNWDDETANLNSTENDPQTILSTTNSTLWVSKKTPFNSTYFNTIIAGVGVTLVPEYWNGSGWTALTWAANGLQDQTTNLTDHGAVKWEKSTMADWTRWTPPGRDSGYNLYWMRFRTTTAPTIAPTLQGVFPQGEKRLAVYSGHRDAIPSFWVGTRGNTYVKHALKTTSTAPQPTELVTFAESKAYTDSAIALTQSTTWYLNSNRSTNRVTVKSMSATCPTTNTTTTITPAVGTNVISTYCVPVAIGTNTLYAGAKFRLLDYKSGSGNAGPTFYGMWKLVELASNVTNVLAESALSTTLATGPTLVDMTITLATNCTVTSTNNLGVQACGVRVGGNNVSMSCYVGASYQSAFTIGGAAALQSETDPVWSAAKAAYTNGLAQSALVPGLAGWNSYPNTSTNTFFGSFGIGTTNLYAGTTPMLHISRDGSGPISANMWNGAEGITLSSSNGISLRMIEGGVSYPSVVFLRSRGPLNNPDIVQNGDQLGSVTFQAWDGVTRKSGATIGAFMDGTPGANDVPTKLVFATCPDGAATTVDRMAIKESGNVGIGIAAPTERLHVEGNLLVTTNLTVTGVMTNTGAVQCNSTLGVAGNTGMGGAVNPSNTLVISADTGSTSYGSTHFNASTPVVMVSSNQGVQLRMAVVDNVTAGNRPVLQMYRYRGSHASPAVVVDGDAIASWIAVARDSTAFRNVASIDSSADGTVGTGVPANLRFSTTAVGATARAERMRITPAGYVGIGTTTPTVALDVTGAITASSTITGNGTLVLNNTGVAKGIELAASSSSGYGYIQIGKSATAANNWHLGSENDGTFRLWNGTWGSGVEKAKVDSTGLLTMAGGGTFGGVITGNGSGVTNVSDMLRPSVVSPGAGMVASDNYYLGPGWSVALSDADANLYLGYHVPVAGTYKISMLWSQDTANSGKTIGLHLYSANHSDGTTGWTGAWNGSFWQTDWNIAMSATAGYVTRSTFGTAFTTLTNNSYYGLSIAKTDTAGSAAGSWYIQSVTLIRQ